MFPSVYDYDNYKTYLGDAINSYPEEGRGIRKQIAYAINCQVPYISQVLNSAYHLSSEQSFLLTQFLKLNDSEADYFMKLVNFNRTSNTKYKEHLEHSLKKQKMKNSDLRKSVKIQNELSAEDQAVYYSHWAYAATHMLLTIPSIRTEEDVRARLRLPPVFVRQVLKFLVDKNLLSQQKGIFRAKQFLVHLSKDSKLLSQHHRNFRLLAAEESAVYNENSFHYSSAISCSKTDINRIRKLLEDVLKEIIEKVKVSKEEELAILNLDCFTINAS